MLFQSYCHSVSHVTVGLVVQLIALKLYRGKCIAFNLYVIILIIFIFSIIGFKLVHFTKTMLSLEAYSNRVKK